MEITGGSSLTVLDVDSHMDHRIAMKLARSPHSLPPAPPPSTVPKQPPLYPNFVATLATSL